MGRTRRRPRTAADGRLDQALRMARSTAVRLDHAAVGAGDVLRDRVAAAITRAVDEHTAGLTARHVSANPRFRDPRGSRDLP